MRPLLRSFAALVLVAVLAAPAAALEDAPVVAFSDGDRVRTASVSGERVARLPGLRSYSLDGGLLAGVTARGNIAAYNARSGQRRFTIRDGIEPTVIDRRGRVAFWGVFERDEQSNSLWVRQIDGDVRKVVQFANGEGLPGYDPGFEGDNTMLSTSFDRTGSRVAVAQGNDVSLFIYDVFVVDVSDGSVRRITDDSRSRAPALAPRGRRLVYQQDMAPCGGGRIHPARLVLESSRGTNRERLTGGDCDRWFSNARWVTTDSVVAYRTSRVDGELQTDLVMINVDSGRRRLLTSSGDVALFSAAEGRVAYERANVDGYSLLDVETGTSTVVAEGSLARVTGDRQTF